MNLAKSWREPSWGLRRISYVRGVLGNGPRGMPGHRNLHSSFTRSLETASHNRPKPAIRIELGVGRKPRLEALFGWTATDNEEAHDDRSDEGKGNQRCCAPVEGLRRGASVCREGMRYEAEPVQPARALLRPRTGQVPESARQDPPRRDLSNPFSQLTDLGSLPSPRVGQPWDTSPGAIVPGLCLFAGGLPARWMVLHEVQAEANSVSRRKANYLPTCPRRPGRSPDSGGRRGCWARGRESL